MKIVGIDLEGDVMLDDGRYVNPKTGKASRKIDIAIWPECE